MDDDGLTAALTRLDLDASRARLAQAAGVSEEDVAASLRGASEQG
ncbi:hypothetical protein [Streptosporangium canum]